MLFKLFFIFVKIGFCAIGGAYSFIPLLERELVEKYKFLAHKEFYEVLGMSKLFPGALSAKYATYTGYKMAGLWGAVFANLGIALPAVIIVLFIARYYFQFKETPFLRSALKGVQLGIFSMLIALALGMFNFSYLVKLKPFFIIAITFSLFYFTKIHPLFIIIISAVLGVILF